MIEQISIFDLIQEEDRFSQSLKKGSLFAEGKIRICMAAKLLPLKDLAGFLREEYGIGGFSIIFADGHHGFSQHDSKGITLIEFKSEWKELHSWQESAKQIKRLVCCDDYLTEKEKSQLAVIVSRYGNTLPRARTGW